MSTQINFKPLTILIGRVHNKELYKASRQGPTFHRLIDFPENFLHPEDQLKRIEEITREVNKDLFTVILTHSPYILDHLNNLIRAAESEYQDDLVNLFILKTKDAFISPKKVSAYEITNDGPIDLMKIHEDGHKTIEWDSFSEVSNKVIGIQWDISDIEDKKIKEKRRNVFCNQLSAGDRTIYTAISALINLRKPTTEANINNILIQSGCYKQVHADGQRIPEIVSQKLSRLVDLEVLYLSEENKEYGLKFNIFDLADEDE